MALILFIEFIIVTIVVVFASMRLADDADTIEQHSSFNPVFLGLVLSAATSLPEMVSSLTSVSLGSDVTAVSNLIGSNIFNIFALVVINLVMYKKKIFRRVPAVTFKTARTAIIMYVLIIISLIATNYGYSPLFPRLPITITSFIILGLYCYSVYKSGSDEEAEVVDLQKHINLNKHYASFLVLVVINVVSSMVLAHKVEAIVELTGMNEAVAGAVLVGIATSLPNVITCLTLIRKNKMVMATSSIIGSNAFNFFTLTICDFSSDHSIFRDMDQSIFVFAVIGLLICLVTYNLDKVRGRFYAIPSVVIICLYLASVIYSAVM